jgi:adenosine kinase
MKPIIISGSIAIDRIMHFKGQYQDYLLPDKLSSVSISILLDAMHDSDGGVGANIAYSLGLMGARPVLLGAVGEDGQDYLERLGRIGVDTRHVHISRLPTAAFNVISDSAENQVGGFYPGAMFDSDTLSLEPWKGTDAIVVVSPHDPKAMRRQVLEATKWQLRLCYDVGQQVSNLDATDLAAGVDAAQILILNDYELAALSAKIGRSDERLKATVPVVITTLGKDGSIVEGASVPKSIRIPVVRPGQVLDPTGAGDAYRSGLLYGLARGWDLATSARLGATVAAYTIEQPGTQKHSFTPAEVAARYRSNFKQELPLTESAHAHHKN